MSGFVDRLKALFGATPPPPGDDYRFIYVYLPEPLAPDEREGRYGDPLNAELRLAGLGEVSGGGALLAAPDAEGRQAIIYAGVDVDATDLDGALALLRQHLPELGCPPDTRLEYHDADADWQDVYDGATWRLRQPPTRHLGED